MIKHLRAVFIGNFAMPERKHVYSLKSYATFFNSLVEDQQIDLSIFAGYIVPGEAGFEFSNEKRLNERIRFRLSKGNTPTTKLLPFIWNNTLLLLRLTLYSLKKGDYFMFLPSPIGVWSAVITIVFKRKKTLGLYIGGYYQAEQSFEQRKGSIKRWFKKQTASVVERLLRYIIKNADYIITSSYEIHHSLGNTGKTFLTPPMINVDCRDLDYKPQVADQRYITFCGELRHAKGIFDLLESFYLLISQKRIAGYKLKIIGSGHAFEEMRQFVKDKNIEEAVFFAGQIKDQQCLKEALASSSIFVLPSYSEGFPRVAYECFTLGVPSILTPVGGIPFFVKDCVHCLFSEPGNVENLALKIETLLKDDSLRNRLSLNAKELMKQIVFPRIEKEGSLAKMVTKITTGL